MHLNIPQSVTPYNLLEPATDAAGRTSSYKSLKGAVKAWIVCHINQGNAATILLSPLQATAVAGTGSKAISAARIWTKLDEALTVFTQQLEAASYTTDAGTTKKIVIFELDLAKVLDQAGNFDCIAISTGASNLANLTSALLLVQHSHQGAHGDQPAGGLTLGQATSGPAGRGSPPGLSHRRRDEGTHPQREPDGRGRRDGPVRGRERHRDRVRGGIHDPSRPNRNPNPNPNPNRRKQADAKRPAKRSPARPEMAKKKAPPRRVPAPPKKRKGY